MIRPFAVVLLAASAVCAQVAPAASELEKLVDSTAERARKEFNVPGISVAVVKNGKVVLAKGYGVRKLGAPEPMTANTLVGIASNTKAFTSAALAMLVDEKKLGWNDRVVDRLPEFALSDPYATREMRIRDLPCHRSGLSLGAGDLMFFPGSDLSASDILYRLRFVPLTGGFRAGYAYDNVLYNVIGAVVARVSGMPWDEFIRTRFFAPLGMKRSLTSVRQVKPGEDVVAPHAMDDGVLKALEDSPLDNVAPAGSIVSSALDMTQWVTTLLNKGTAPNGTRLISEAQMKTLWTPLILIPQHDPPPELAELKSNFAGYAMGEVVSEYRGHLIVSHTGGLAGMVTSVAMLPEEKLGVIVLTNQQEGGVLMSVQNTVLDHYLGANEKDWVGAFAKLSQAGEERATKAVAEAGAKRNANSKPSLPAAAYAGRYRDPWYGDVVVTDDGGRLAIRFTHSPALAGSLEHWQYDTFVARWKDRSLDADAYVTFQLNAAGKVEGVRMEAVSPSTDFSFDFQDLRLSPAPADAKPWD